LQAQTLHSVCPVSDGEFNSAAAGDLDAPMPGGSPVLEDVPDVVLDDPVGPELAFSSPGDCPGGMNGDCGALVMYLKQAPEAVERAAL
jgi:hypothetical protein